MTHLTMPQVAPVLAAARDSMTHDSEPTWLYVLNFWDSRTIGTCYTMVPDVSLADVTETLQFYAHHNPDGTVPREWAHVPAVQLNPVPAAPSRLRLRHGDEVMEIDVVAALELAQSLPFIIGQLTAPDLVVDKVAETTTCPHCATVFRFEEDCVREVDIDIRWNAGSLREAPSEVIGLILDISQADHESESIAHICEHCSKPVALPDGIESLWS